jgi:hypothetical protein
VSRQSSATRWPGAHIATYLEINAASSADRRLSRQRPGSQSAACRDARQKESLFREDQKIGRGQKGDAAQRAINQATQRTRRRPKWQTKRRNVKWQRKRARNRAGQRAIVARRCTGAWGGETEGGNEARKGREQFCASEAETAPAFAPSPKAWRHGTKGEGWIFCRPDER